MRVVFGGHTFCDQHTLKRLLLIADEVGFLDRPSVMLGKWGTIGRASEIRQFKTDDLPVIISAHEAPSGDAATLYVPFIERDARNPAFVKTVAEGLARDDRFSSKFIQPQANYGGYTGVGLRSALVRDPSLASRTYGEPENIDFRQGIETREGREHLFHMQVVEASIQVTTAMVVGESAGLAPVTDDPYMARLLALRAADAAYVETPQSLTPMLGLSVAQAVIPDEALERIQIKDVFDYRSATKDAYRAWAVEVDRLVANIQDTPPEQLEARITSILATEVAPKVIEYRNEMAGVRDQLFGSLVKGLARWEVPSLSVAYVSGLSFAGALAVFAGAAVPVVPALVDYFQDRRKVARKHAVSYLIGASKG